MPNVTGLTYDEAKNILKAIEIDTDTEMDAGTIVTEQLPKAGIQITKGTKIKLYSN